MSRSRKQRGSAILEFALTGVPLIFIWISSIQMALGMWHYHTIQYAVKTTATYLTTHGAQFVNMGGGALRISDAANVLRANAIGMPPDEIQVTWTAEKSSTDIISVSCRLDNCQTDNTVWPPNGYNAPGMDITIRADYLFRSSIAMVAAGSGAPVLFGAAHLPGYSRQSVIF